MTGFAFAERMAGTASPADESAARAFAFDLEARSPTLMRPWGLTLAEATGTVDVEGLAAAAPARGWLELSPFAERRMRYVLEFAGDDGTPYRFEGHKRIRPWSIASYTTLRGEIRRADDGAAWGRATAHFSLRRQLLGLVASVRPWSEERASASGVLEELVARRWRGRRGRLEVWYATLTDPATGEGFWLHHELLAPRVGTARRQGWAVAFPPGETPVVGRFAGAAGDHAEPGPGVPAFEAGGVVVRPGALRGEAGALRWDLHFEDGGRPLYTFPAAAWQRELLPAAQIVPAPTARFSGTFAVGEREVLLDGAPGNLARIYGQGNAERWGWLHADLGGGEVLEIVAAVSRRPGLNRLPPLSFVQLRVGGRDWPARPLLAAPRLRTELREHGFTTSGRWGDRRLRADVRLDPAQSVALPYDDTEGDGPVCTNSERASAEIVLERRSGGGWALERSWRLDGTAHAEIGLRGP